ncbi:hypothetical protein BV61_02305, partial [Candidatus Synechococcus spongiarum LMB bulk15M]
MTKPDSSNSSPTRPLVLHDLPPFPQNLSPDASTPSPHQVGGTAPTPSSRQDTSPAASLKGLLRQTLASCTSTLALSAAPLAALLVLAPTPPAFAEDCYYDNGKFYVGGVQIYEKEICTGIYLGDNNLSRLPEGIFSGLNNLQALYLGGNNLSSLPGGTFSGLNNLQELHLHRNNLSSLPEGIFSGLNNLQELYLRGNKLSRLPEGIFSGLNNLYSLGLENNNLSCLPSIPSSVTKLAVDVENLPPCGEEPDTEPDT